ncbi:hypothetical protein CFAM422_002544 [Trichoderma lentiforme]|uniref:Zn(2)-C6 fungal-type domain-containing protein n=1 Tax=Trichoderma lentiforme TaxID=1567552 RepID=A0A9P4XND6_9HYPO|nr:hypothetical protein CFAM422_002544 [Trichoderma lentiforme]
MESDTSHEPTLAGSLAPAPYGRACVACSRAKCKCFYRSDGSGCERCHRLGKACEQTASIRKRRTQKASSRPVQPPPPRNLLEEKLDNVLSILRSQASTKQLVEQTLEGEPSKNTTLSNINSLHNPITPSIARGPEVVIDTTESVVHLFRPVERPDDLPSSATSPQLLITGDVPIHGITALNAEEQLATFRRAFIPAFPFIHIPTTTSASDLYREKPFVWLVMMALTTKVVSKQFDLADHIWKIISQRVLCEHHANVDLLLGIICFASWSHYFKKDKPFMTMLTQMAVSMAFELDLHKDTTPGISPRDKPSRLLTRQTYVRPVRTMEERRTFAALYYLTSATWAAYRKTYPLDWTPYLEDCARVLSQGTETSLDILLTTQIRCQLITNGITCPKNENIEIGGFSSPSRLLYTALLKQLDDIRQSLPDEFQSERVTRFYLLSTELKIKEFFLRHKESNNQHNGIQIRRVQDLESALTVIEHLLAVFDDLPILDWVGISVDYVTQLTHCFVVLFKLNTLKEPGWDLFETRKRADVIQILDQYSAKAERALEIIGIVGNEGPNWGLFNKGPHFFKTIRMLMWTEMATNMTYLNVEGDNPEELPGLTADNIVPDDLVMSLAQESWLSNLIEDPWDYISQLNETEYSF